VDHDERIAFTCPRCARAVEERFYGPCAVCCGELRASLVAVARDVDVEAFAPKMHVVPNAVASKE
jgi:hypothetical protein